MIRAIFLMMVLAGAARAEDVMMLKPIGGCPDYYVALHTGDGATDSSKTICIQVNGLKAHLDHLDEAVKALCQFAAGCVGWQP